MPPKSRNNKRAIRNRKRTKIEAPERSIPSKFKQDIVGILLLALAVFVFVANLSTSTGLVGFFVVKTFLRSAMGVGVLVLPFFIGLYGIILLLRHEVKELTVRLFGLLILFLTYIAVAQFYEINYFTDVEALYFRGAGGVLGYSAHYALMRSIGLWGSYIILTAVAVIGLLMLFNVTVLSLVSFIKHLFAPQADEQGQKKSRDSKRTSQEKRFQAAIATQESR